MDRATMTRALGYAVFLSAVWALAAWIRPTSTYHLAPILAAGAAPAVAVLSNATSARRDLIGLAILGTGLTVAVSLVLSAASFLRGPSLLPSGGALLEAVVFAVVGGAAALLFAVSRGSRNTVTPTR